MADYAGIKKTDYVQGKSFRKKLAGNTPDDWRKEMYYRYWLHKPERPAHFGIRNNRYKLIFFYGQRLGKKGACEETTEPAWEFYDLKEDPNELYNAIDENRCEGIIAQMKSAMVKEREKYGDLDEGYPVMRGILEDNMLK